MLLETGKSYRAKTASGQQITFTVIDTDDPQWPAVELDEDGVVEPRVSLNRSLLLWISSEPKRKLAISKAADEIIESLETAIEGVQPPVS